MKKNRKDTMTLDELSAEAISRGNDLEIRSCRGGKKVFEVSKRLVAVMLDEAEEDDE